MSLVAFWLTMFGPYCNIQEISKATSILFLLFAQYPSHLFNYHTHHPCHHHIPFLLSSTQQYQNQLRTLWEINRAKRPCTVYKSSSQGGRYQIWRSYWCKMIPFNKRSWADWSKHFKSNLSAAGYSCKSCHNQFCTKAFSLLHLFLVMSKSILQSETSVNVQHSCKVATTILVKIWHDLGRWTTW